jgi:hypothetical protein
MWTIARLEQAQSFLVNEWMLSFSIPGTGTARMNHLLGFDIFT